MGIVPNIGSMSTPPSIAQLAQQVNLQLPAFSKFQQHFNGSWKRIGLMCLYVFIAWQILAVSWRLSAGSHHTDENSVSYSGAVMAKRISAAELMARPLPNANNPAIVPRLFHQSWSSLKLPAKFQKWSRTCRQKHPDWEYVLWTDEDNHALVEKYAPWLLDTYDHLKGPIYQADMIRNLYMFLYGG
jgi:hypothetical protein